MVRISVEDQGPGIAPEQQAGLFERFYRVRTDTDAPGVGLGLAIAKGIVEAHGGSIGIDSEPGNGTRVWFTLPNAARQAQDDGSAVRILLVDDDRELIDLLAFALKRAGLEPIAAHDAAVGAAHVRGARARPGRAGHQPGRIERTGRAQGAAPARASCR